MSPAAGPAKADSRLPSCRLAVAGLMLLTCKREDSVVKSTVVLAEDWVWFLAPMWRLTSPYNSSTKGANVLF